MRRVEQAINSINSRGICRQTIAYEQSQDSWRVERFRCVYWYRMCAYNISYCAFYLFFQITWQKSYSGLNLCHKKGCMGFLQVFCSLMHCVVLLVIQSWPDLRTRVMGNYSTSIIRWQQQDLAVGSPFPLFSLELGRATSEMLLRISALDSNFIWDCLGLPPVSQSYFYCPLQISCTSQNNVLRYKRSSQFLDGPWNDNWGLIEL